MSLRFALPETPWFPVVGGPPPPGELLRTVLLSLVLPLFGLWLGLHLPEPWRVPCLVLSSLSAVPLFGLLRYRWKTRQKVRLFGNLIEHFDGVGITRVVLTQAVVSAAASPPRMLVMLLDDGRQQVALARQADFHELSGLPPCSGTYLELDPEDFEVIRQATARTYAVA